MFLDREKIGEDLGRVVGIGQAVPYRHAAEAGKFLDDGLLETSELDPVEHASQDPGRILDVFLVPELDVVLAQVLGVGSLVDAGDGEGATRTCRGFFEDQGDVFSGQAIPPDPHALLCFQVCRKLQEISDLLGGEILQCQEAAAFQVDWHFPILLLVWFGDISLLQGRGSRSRGMLMQRGPPLPLPSSAPLISKTLMPFSRSTVFETTLRL